jgi:hypothetical protein
MDNTNSRNRLLGVPIKSAPALWRRIFSRQVTHGRSKVSEQSLSADLYCPRCGKRQPFSCQCAFCRCVFSSFIDLGADTASRIIPQFEETVPSGDEHHGKEYGLLAPIHDFLVRFRKAALWVRVITVYVILLLTISLAIGIDMYRHRHLYQGHYQHNYVLALYGIKSGMDMTDRVYQGKYKAWKYGVSEDAQSSIIIDSQTLADLHTVKDEIDRIMVEMGAPPEEYDQAAQILQKLYLTYEMMNSIIINSPDSLSHHKTEIDAARKDFFREIENLKANMPASLAEELKKAGQKYDLRFMALDK